MHITFNSDTNFNNFLSDCEDRGLLVYLNPEPETGRVWVTDSDNIDEDELVEAIQINNGDLDYGD